MPAALILMNPSRPGQKIPASTVVLGPNVKAAISRAIGSKGGKMRRNPVESAKRAAEKAQQRVELAIERMREAKARAAAAKQHIKEVRSNPSARLTPRKSRATKKAGTRSTPNVRQDHGYIAGSLPDNALAARKNPTRGKEKYMAKSSKRGMRANPRYARKNPRGMSRGMPRGMRRNPAYDDYIKSLMDLGKMTREQAIAYGESQGVKMPKSKQPKAPRAPRGPAKSRMSIKELEKTDPAAAEARRRAQAKSRSSAAQRAVARGEYASVAEAEAGLRQAQKARAKARNSETKRLVAKARSGEPLTAKEQKRVDAWAKRMSGSKAARHARLLAMWPEDQFPATRAARAYANEHPDAWDTGGNLARMFVRMRHIREGRNDARGKKAVQRYPAERRAAVEPHVEFMSDPISQNIAEVLGISPNSEFGDSGLRKNPYESDMSLKTLIPMVAMGMGATIGVWAATAKVSALAKGYVQNEMVKKAITPVVALGLGFGGFMLLKRSEGLKKYSGLALCGGVATAVAAIMATKFADGQSVEAKYGIALGDYHVGDYHVGDYHVGDYHVGAVTQLNVGDYHVGAVVPVSPGIDAVTDRRIPTVPGEKMERHETRRDYPEKLVDSFGGTLAGDIFDQA